MLKLTAFIVGIGLIAGVFIAQARPVYAKREGKSCGYCHLSPYGGGERGFRGLFYGANDLSFDRFEEKREARIAGVDPESLSFEAKPTVAYVGGVSGNAVAQIGLAALKGPVLVAFISGSDTDSEQFINQMRSVASAYGLGATVVAVAPVSVEKALDLTDKLGNQMRILPDEDRAAIKKWGVGRAFDLVVVSKLQQKSVKLDGYSLGNLKKAVETLAEYGVSTPKLNLSKVPTSVKRGSPLQ